MRTSPFLCVCALGHFSHVRLFTTPWIVNKMRSFLLTPNLKSCLKAHRRAT